MRGNGINIEYVSHENAEKYLDGFVDVYIQAFGGPPYCEKFESKWVREYVWNKHIDNGCIIIAKNGDNNVIGLCCAISFECISGDDPNISVKEFLSGHSNHLPFELESSCLISELAVSLDYRRMGIAKLMLEELYRWMKESCYKNYAARTAGISSNSKQLLLKLGAKLLMGIKQELKEHVEGIESQSKERIYLYGEV